MQTFDALHITKSFDFGRTMSAITEYFLNFNRTQKEKRMLPRQSISASFRWLNMKRAQAKVIKNLEESGRTHCAKNFSSYIYRIRNTPINKNVIPSLWDSISRNSDAQHHKLQWEHRVRVRVLVWIFFCALFSCVCVFFFQLSLSYHFDQPGAVHILRAHFGKLYVRSVCSCAVIRLCIKENVDCHKWAFVIWYAGSHFQRTAIILHAVWFCVPVHFLASLFFATGAEWILKFRLLFSSFFYSHTHTKSKFGYSCTVPMTPFEKLFKPKQKMEADIVSSVNKKTKKRKVMMN